LAEQANQKNHEYSSAGLDIAVSPKSRSEPAARAGTMAEQNKAKKPMNAASPISLSLRAEKRLASAAGLAPAFWQNKANWDNSNDFNEDEEGEILHPGALRASPRRQKPAARREASAGIGLPSFWQNEPRSKNPMITASPVSASPRHRKPAARHRARRHFGRTNPSRKTQ
jgi:hypothetical protein